MAYMNNSDGYLSKHYNHFYSPLNMKTYMILRLKTVKPNTKMYLDFRT